MESNFIVYRSCVKDIGLLNEDVAYGVVGCYGEIQEFLSLQDKFVRDLPQLANSTLLGSKAANLNDREKLLVDQIDRVRGLLEKQQSNSRMTTLWVPGRRPRRP
jgi:hypothetical protein